MDKILFLDRDGTIIEEPEKNQQVDSVKKLKFETNVISVLSKISKEFDYKLVMVTNQDGLGTMSFPEKTFWPAHNIMLEILKSEGIVLATEFKMVTRERDRSGCGVQHGTALRTLRLALGGHLKQVLQLCLNIHLF